VARAPSPAHSRITTNHVGAGVLTCPVERSSTVFAGENDGALVPARAGRSRPHHYCSFAYSALASFRIGISGSASFHNAKKS
jgi:hypothetical protein